MVLRAVVAIETQLVQRAITPDNGKRSLFCQVVSSFFGTVRTVTMNDVHKEMLADGSSPGVPPSFLCCSRGPGI